MESLLSVSMVSSDDFTPEYLITPQTTPRSKLSSENCSWTQLIQIFLRILIASIRNLGRCPCPRCLIPLDLVHNLGMTRDMTQQISKARVDNSERQGKVSAARRLIYERNMQVNSAAVEELLRDWSGVPTAVSQP